MSRAADRAARIRGCHAGSLALALALPIGISLFPSTVAAAQSAGQPCVSTAADGTLVITDAASDPSCARRRSRAARPGPLRVTFVVAEMLALAHEAAERFRVDHRLVESLVEMESGFDPGAVSRKGAMGLMQLMPETARMYGVADAFDPWANLEAGVRHLKGLLTRYDGDLERALAAYNAGEGAVERYGGVPPFAETRGYVFRVLYRYRQRVAGIELH